MQNLNATGNLSSIIFYDICVFLLSDSRSAKGKEHAMLNHPKRNIASKVLTIELSASKVKNISVAANNA